MDAVSRRKLMLLASIEIAVQFSSSMMELLMTPYAKLLGINTQHTLLLWLSTPIGGLIMPLFLRHCSRLLATTRVGQRKPLIAVGVAMQCLGLILICYARDIGHMVYDVWWTPGRSPSRSQHSFIIGIWILTMSKYLIEGSLREFLTDLCQGNQNWEATATSWFIFFNTVGSVLGYAISYSSGLHKIIPFAKNSYCDKTCADLKASCIVNIVLLCTLVGVAFKKVLQPAPQPEPVIEHSGSFKAQVKEAVGWPFSVIYIISFLLSLAWFPYLVLGSSWVAEGIYGGSSTIGASTLYLEGVHEAALGFIFNALVVGVVSLIFNRLTKILGGTRMTWGLSNLVFVVALGTMVVLGKKAMHARKTQLFDSSPPKAIRMGTLASFGALGLPQAAMLAIPSLLTNTYSATAATTPGQVRAIADGLLNLVNALSEMLGLVLCFAAGLQYSMFIVGVVAASISSLIAFNCLPPVKPDSENTAV